MNVERLNTVLSLIDEEFEQQALSSLLQTFLTSFTQNINQPNVQNSEAFLSSKASLQKALNECYSNKFSPSQHKITEEIGGKGFVGNSLMNALENIIESNYNVPGQAVLKVQEHIKKFKDFFSTVKKTNENLIELGINYDFTQEDEYEIGIIIPSSIFKNNLEDLGKELKQIDLHIKTFGEFAGDETASPTIRALSSGSFEIFLNSLPIVAECIFEAIEKIVFLYLATLEIRKCRKELEEKRVPADILKPLEQFEHQNVTKELNTIADYLIKKYYKKQDKARDKEIRTKLVQALKYMAKRIDQGVDFEVTPPSETNELSQEATEEQKDQQKEKNMKVYQLQERILNLTKLPSRDKPILALTEPKNDEQNDEQIDE